ncbi:MAG: hypothetical protein NT069_21155 [Planctomycetota bacterium]|nr:hypothetical protein [Planctomycetota bacterium]
MFENIAENIVGVMKGIWDFIASGGTAELEIAWTPLLDGFKNTVEALPDLPKRVASDLERTLTTERDRLAETIGGGMQDAIANAPGRRRTLPNGPEKPGTPDSLMSESAGKRSEQNAALMRGSAEAVTALVTAANGNRDPVAEANQKALEEQLAEAKKQNELLDDIKGELKGQGGMQTVRY